GFAVSNLDSKSNKTMHKNGVLVIDLSKNFQENPTENPLKNLFDKKQHEQPSLQELIELIHIAKTDSLIAGIYIKAADNSNGRAVSEEIRNALSKFSQSKKPIISFGEVISEKSYYIANISNKIYTNPFGGLEWNGYAVEMMFLKGLLDKLEIEPQIFYAGKFKSATEPLRFTQMSKESKLQTSVLLNNMYNQLISTTSSTRKIDPTTLLMLANTGKIQTAKNALDAHLVDGIVYEDQVKDSIKKMMHIPYNDKINFVEISDYKEYIGNPYSYNKSKIAVILASGEIVDGKGDKSQIGSEKFVSLINDLIDNNNIKGVVLRINSPGGSALASENILHAIENLKKNVPVFISMGDVAASGGYYIACTGDSIFANKNTITGSIGVFGIIPNLSKFFKNKLGISFDGVSTGPFAQISTTKPLSNLEKRFIQNSVDSVYNQFKFRVATGRKKEMSKIEEIAQGRVWIGEDALKIGLIDKIGTLSDAIEAMKKFTKYSNAQVVFYPEKSSIFDDLIDEIKDGTKTYLLKQEMGLESYSILQQYKKISTIANKPQMMLPFNFNNK
ncbi:MAG: signal peptide peptidase SppA, partial [Sediminibacterium sp.]|nr:signal peptide peptidase SppA [Sediminibacterium sp.]